MTHSASESHAFGVRHLAANRVYRFVTFLTKSGGEFSHALVSGAVDCRMQFVERDTDYLRLERRIEERTHHFVFGALDVEFDDGGRFRACTFENIEGRQALRLEVVPGVLQVDNRV